MIEYVPAAGKVTEWLPVVLASVSNPSWGILRSWAAPPLQANVTTPPGAIFTEPGDQRYREPLPETPTKAVSGLPAAGTCVGVAVGCGATVGAGEFAVGGGFVAVAATVVLVGSAVAAAVAVAVSATAVAVVV